MNLAAGTYNYSSTHYTSSLQKGVSGSLRADQWSGNYYTLLLEMIRSKFNSGININQLKSELRNIDWQHLTLFAEMYDVKPVIYDYLRQNFSELLPASLKKDIDTYFRIATPHAYFQLRELAQVADILSEHGISNTTFKGPVLAVQAHGDIALRRSVDMDVLISPDKLQAAEGVLISHGYQPFHKVRRLSKSGKKSFLWLSQQYPFKKAGGIFNLDLHTSIMPLGYRFSKPYGSYEKHSERHQISDFRVNGLSTEDLLVVLCYHGAKNRWKSLKYVLDITALVHSNPDINWGMIEQTIARYGDRRIISLGLSLANQLFHMSLTEEMSIIIGDDTVVKSLTRKLIQLLESKEQNTRMSYFQRVQFHLLVQKSVRAKIGYIAHSAFKHIWTLVYN